MWLINLIVSYTPLELPLQTFYTFPDLGTKLDVIDQLEQTSDLEKLNHEIKMAKLEKELNSLKSVKRSWLHKFINRDQVEHIPAKKI